MFEAGKTAQVAEEMKYCSLTVLGIIQTRWDVYSHRGLTAGGGGGGVAAVFRSL